MLDATVLVVDDDAAQREMLAGFLRDLGAQVREAGDGQQALELVRGARFDLVFLDADKEGYVDYYEATLPLLRSGGLLVADNTLWSGAVHDPIESSDHGIVNFNRHVQADQRVEQVLLSVRDGIMLCRKT